MNLYLKMAAIAAAALLGIFAGYHAWDVMAIHDVVLHHTHAHPFSLYGLERGDSIVFCNPSPFYVELDVVRLEVLRGGEAIAAYDAPPRMLPPSRVYAVNGTFTAPLGEDPGGILLGMDELYGDPGLDLSGADHEALPPPDDAGVRLTLGTQVAGVSLYTETVTHEPADFYAMMDGDISGLPCY